MTPQTRWIVLTLLSRRCFAALLVAVILGPCPCPAQPADEAFAHARLAFDEGRYEASVRAFEEVTRRDPDNAEAHFLLARIYAETPLQDVKRARKALQKAIELNAEAPRYLALRLYLMREHPSNFLPDYQAWKQKELAEKILTLDSTHALAHVELGEWEAALYFQFRHAIYVAGKLSGNTRPSDPFLDVDRPARRAAGGAMVLDKSEPATDAYPRAVAHLERALASDPSLRAAYAPLMRLYTAESDFSKALALLRRMKLFFSEDPMTWLYTGMAQYYSGAFQEADASFATAFHYLDPAERAAFDDLILLFKEQKEQHARYAQDEDAETVGARFWTFHDPRLLTSYSERRLEHYARLTYADLFFGDPQTGTKGWNTDIGQVLVRYGLPGYVEDRKAAEETPFGTGKTESGFRTWYYDDFKLDFVKAFPRDPYLFTDYIEDGAQRVFHKVPHRSQYEPRAQREPVPYLVSTFKGIDGKADVYVSYGIPVPFKPARNALALTIRTGTFLLHPDRGLAVEQRQSFTSLASRQITRFDERPHWLNAQHLQAAAGTYEIAVEFETETARVVGFERSAVTVPDYTGDALMLSDVMPAYDIFESAEGRSTKPIAEGYIVRHDVAIRATPRAVFPSGQPLFLYFETYNLAQRDDGATAYEIEAVLVPWDGRAGGLTKLLRNVFGGKQREGVSVRFDDQGATPHEAHYMLLDTQDQPPGRYVLALRVRDKVTGASAETSRDITLE
ncbi:MAG: tetratricopeptide repeat protein [Rhodothermales bacterium]